MSVIVLRGLVVSDHDNTGDADVLNVSGDLGSANLDELLQVTWNGNDGLDEWSIDFNSDLTGELGNCRTVPGLADVGGRLLEGMRSRRSSGGRQTGSCLSGLEGRGLTMAFPAKPLCCGP